MRYNIRDKACKDYIDFLDQKAYNLIIMNWFRKYFIPHEGNEYKPHLLRNEIAFGLLALVLIVEGAFLSQAVLLGRGTGFLALVLPNTLVDQTNQTRIASNLPPLTENPLLTAAAQKKANDMAAKGYFAHTSPEGITPWYWFQQAGYKYTYAGENLAVNYSDSNDVTRAWLNSPAHRDNILNSHYTQIGIATAQGTYQGQSTVFVVQLFGRPPAPAPVVVATAPKPAPVVAPKPVPVPAPKPAPVVVPKPVAKPAPVSEPAAKPIQVVPPTQIASNQFNSVAIEGASTEMPAGASQPVSQPMDPESVNEPIPASEAPAAAAPVVHSNLIQRIFAAPRLTTNVIYIVLAALIILALILNVFMKVSVQHPQLVLNGLMILFAIGTLALFNQHLLLKLAHAQIF